MLHYVICHVLLPKDSNLAQINDLEMQVLFAVKNKIRINWLPTMMYHLKQQLSLKTRLPYGRLISRILELTDMEIGREPFIAMTTTANEINNVTIMKNTGIVQSNDGSYKYDDGSSSSNFPIPEGGITNEFLYTTMMSQHRETTRAIKSLRNLVLSSHNLPVEDDEVNRDDRALDVASFDVGENTKGHLYVKHNVKDIQVKVVEPHYIEMSIGTESSDEESDDKALRVRFDDTYDERTTIMDDDFEVFELDKPQKGATIYEVNGHSYMFKICASKSPIKKYPAK
ncbi:hypothetical protein KIW84_031020 [Lathyrus oleraceus]|uniref:Uncharacterized protein n=1 Tax=Pisum sativum TaxID=3888 RepID=A0A9D5AZS3_PEA|nr:hypothetical protein KIW84_031020 [Pisum sativum]